MIVTTPSGRLESVRGSLPCLQDFGGATTVKFGIGIWGAIPIGSGLVRSLRLSAGYADLSTGFEADAETFEAYDYTTATYTELQYDASAPRPA